MNLTKINQQIRNLKNQLNGTLAYYGYARDFHCLDEDSHMGLKDCIDLHLEPALIRQCEEDFKQLDCSELAASLHKDLLPPEEPIGESLQGRMKLFQRSKVVQDFKSLLMSRNQNNGVEFLRLVFGTLDTIISFSHLVDRYLQTNGIIGKYLIPFLNLQEKLESLQINIKDRLENVLKAIEGRIPFDTFRPEKIKKFRATLIDLISRECKSSSPDIFDLVINLHKAATTA